MKRILLIILCCVCSNLYSQNHGFKKTEKVLTVADGLYNRHINHTYIDKQNRVWFVTDNQLGQYEFGKVRNINLSADFSNRGFNHIVQDKLDNLWISENAEWYFPFNVVKTLIFNPKTKQIVSVEKYIGQNLPIHSIFSDNHRNIYISTTNGQVYRFDAVKKTTQLIYSIGNKPLKILYVGAKGMVICCEKDSKADQKLIFLNHQKKVLKEVNFENKFIRNVVETENDLLFLLYDKNQTTLQSLYSGKQVIFPNRKDSYLWNIYYDKYKQFFVFNEANAISFVSKDFKVIGKETFDFLIHDIWIGNVSNYFLSSNNGVHIVNFSKSKFYTFLKNEKAEKINENYSCRTILKLNDTELIVNTNRKRQLINLKTGEVEQVHNFKNKIGENDHFILSALKDKDGDLLFGEDGLVKTNLKTKKDKLLCNLDSTKIWAIETYKDGVLLGLEKKGVIYYDKKNNKSTVFAELNQFFESSIVYDFFVYQNSVFIASENGFYKFSDEKLIKKYTFSAIQEPIQRACFHLSIDSKKTSTLLIATTNGIWEFDLKTDKLKPFIKDKDFNNKKFLAAYRTQNGVWASSEEGVWHFDDNGRLRKIYTEADGLTNNECNRLAHCQDEEGNLYFGGINGLNMLNPLDFSNQTEKHYDLMIDSIYTYADDKIKQTLGNRSLKQLNLDQNEQSVALVLSYEDFKYHCPKQFYYRTDKSILNDWQLLTDHRFVLDNIEYGTTHIELRVISCSDYLNAQTLKFTIFREFPLYMKWYFWLIVTLFLGVIIWGAIKISNHQLKSRNELLQRKVDEQTQSLRESLELKETVLGILVHDVRYPVQSFYDISKKLDFLIKKQDFDRLNLLGKETETRSRKVLWLIDELVYWVKTTNKNWQATKEEKILNNVVRQIFESYQEELQAKKLRFEIAETQILAKIDLSLMIIILRNLVFNTVVHARSGSLISTEIKQHGNQQFTIEFLNEIDTEIPKSEKGMGMGLSLLQPVLLQSGIEISTLHDKDIYIAKVRF